MSLGKIEIVPMDISDLSAAESASVASASTGTNSGPHMSPIKMPRRVSRGPNNERISRKDRAKRRQARRQRCVVDDNSSCEGYQTYPLNPRTTGPGLRRAVTVDAPMNIRRDRSTQYSAPVAPFRRSSTGPMDLPHHLSRSNTSPQESNSHSQPQPYGPLAPLAPSAPKRQASFRCIPEVMDDTSETVTTENEEMDASNGNSAKYQYAYVYQPENQTYQPVPVPVDLPPVRNKRIPRSRQNGDTTMPKAQDAPIRRRRTITEGQPGDTTILPRAQDGPIRRRQTITERQPVRRARKKDTAAEAPAYRRNGSMDSLPNKPRRRESACGGGFERTRSQSLDEMKRWK